MEIAVKKEHVECAIRRDSHHCMIADAIRDQTKAKYILVDVQSIRWSNVKNGKRYVFLTPPSAQKAIIAFDQGDTVRPFTFRLQSPVKTRAMVRDRAGTIASRRRARAKYEKRAKVRGARKSSNVGHATREREYGVRLLQE